MLSALGPIRKAGWGVGAGGGRCVLYTSGSIRKPGGGCSAEEGEVPCTKGQHYDLLNSARFTIDY